MQLFTDVCAEDPHFLASVLVSLGNQPVGGADQEKGGGAKEQRQHVLQTWADMLQVNVPNYDVMLLKWDFPYCYTGPSRLAGYLHFPSGQLGLHHE